MASLLLDSGHEVAGVDGLYCSHTSRLQEWRLGNLADRPGFAFHSADVRDVKALKGVVTGRSKPEQISAIVNLAALAGRVF